MKSSSGLFILFLSTLPIICTAAPLKLCYEDTPQPPWTTPDGTGLNLELLRRVGLQTRQEFVFLPMPWKRCIDEVRAGNLDAAIGATETPERRGDGELPSLKEGHPDPDAALNVEHYDVFIRAASGAGWDGKSLRVPLGGVVVPRGYYVSRELRRDGYPVEDSVMSSEEALDLLSHGQADVAVLLGEEAERIASSPQFRGTITLSPTPYSTLPYYLLVSHITYGRERERIESVWNGIRAVRAESDYQELEQRTLSSAQTVVSRSRQ